MGFLLPEKIRDKHLKMKGFQVELLSNNVQVKKFSDDFPETVLKDHDMLSDKYDSLYIDKDYLSRKYSKAWDISSLWRDSVDMIRITWNVLVGESKYKYFV